MLWVPSPPGVSPCPRRVPRPYRPGPANKYLWFSFTLPFFVVNRRFGFARFDCKHGAVGGAQIVNSGLLNQFGRDGADLILNGVDASRIVIKESEGCKQVGASEARKLS